jgi:ketopantoate hydroxymethyltransferase
MLPRIRAMVAADIPVMGHIGPHPPERGPHGRLQVQARTAETARTSRTRPWPWPTPAAFAMVLEASPTRWPGWSPKPSRPHHRIGAGPHCDGQVLSSRTCSACSTGSCPNSSNATANPGPRAPGRPWPRSRPTWSPAPFPTPTTPTTSRRGTHQARQ